MDRVRASDLRLLEDLIRSEGYVSDCDANIAQYGQVHGGIDGLDVVINPAIKIREGHLRIIVALQRSLRLCPSMRMRHEAGTLKASRPAKKTWER